MNENDKNYEEEILDVEKDELTQENETATEHVTEDEFIEECQKLPMWQHVTLVILFLFVLAAIIIGIDFVVDFFTELLKRIF